MPSLIDLTGQAFGRLTVIARAGVSGGHASWHCRCACGQTSDVSGGHLRRGLTRSCGCLKREKERESRPDQPRLRYDLTGRVFSRLTVLRRAGSAKHGTSVWECRCVCGASVKVRSDVLRAGTTRSCGCLQLEGLRVRIRELHSRSAHVHKKHGAAPRSGSSSEYQSWLHLKQRCGNHKHRAYKYYGGRGITVCDRWKNSFEAFLADMGPKPSLRHSIDRINNDGNYEPGNCRWATKVEQRQNQRKPKRTS